MMIEFKTKNFILICMICVFLFSCGKNSSSVSNTPPVSKAGSDQSVTVNTTVTLDGSASSDPDGSPLTYSWAFVAPLPAGSTATIINPETASPTFQADVPGTFTVSLTVSDGTDTHTDQVVISVTNTPPVAEAGPDQHVEWNMPVTLDGSASSDPNGSPLTWSWAFVAPLPAGSHATLSNPETAFPTFQADVPGTFTVSLTVNDGTDTHTDQVEIRVTNSPCFANAGPDQAVQLYTTVTLNGSGSYDIAGSPLTWSWAFATPLPAGSHATLSNPETAFPTFQADVPGIFTISLTVSDGLDIKTDQVVIVVNNTPPVALPGFDKNVPLNTTVTLDGSASYDPNGNPLVYSWAFVAPLPAGSTATLMNPATVTPTFRADVPGTFTVSLTVDDGNATNTDQIVVTVIDGPVADAGNSINVPLYAGITLDGVASSCADGLALTYSWSFDAIPSDSNQAGLTNPNTQTPGFDADAFGRFRVQLIVNDGVKDSAPDFVEIIVGKLPDTGLTTCYDDKGAALDPCPAPGEPFYGQDAHYNSIANQPSYTKLDSSGNPVTTGSWEMVRDNVTGLIWEVKTNRDNTADYFNPHDADNKYTWYDGVHGHNPQSGNYTEAFINSLNNAAFGGFTDWRMPTPRELLSMVNYNTNSPAVYTAYFPNTWPGDYWSSSLYAGSSVWYVAFSGGGVSHYYSDNEKSVRAVRGEPVAPSFTDNGDRTITDHNTGLTWMKTTGDINGDGTIDANDMVNWEDALLYCEDVDFAGHTDWRLPNIKELESIVDRGKQFPVVDPTFFPDTVTDLYWSSSGGYFKNSAAIVNFANGFTYDKFKTYKVYVRAVRGGL